MNILITGARGFIGKNLSAALASIRDGLDKTRRIPEGITLYELDTDTDPACLEEYTKQCDFVYHLAGVNRPVEEAEFMTGNFGFTAQLLECLKRHNNPAPVLMTSSIQAALDNPYGRSKQAGEELILEYGRSQNVKTFVYRLPNVFGKWCRPNYNSVIATFCYNIARGLDITVQDPGRKMTLVYIDDVVDELIRCLSGAETRDGQYYCRVPVEHRITLGEIADMIGAFAQNRKNLYIPDMPDGSFAQKLYSTFLSYLPETEFRCYPIMHQDQRGSFTELFKTERHGQVSVNISKPGVTKGNHWHHTKNEKFAVVAGRGVIRFRRLGSQEILEYYVSGDKIEIIDIPVGYTHSIENLGETDMVTVMWCNTCFDPDRPDTYFLEV